MTQQRSTNLFGRLSNLIRGMFAVWVRDSERQNPRAVYEQAINERTTQYRELKEAVAGILYMRNKIEGEIGERRAEIARLHDEVRRAVRTGQDDISLKCARKMIGNNAVIGVSCQTFVQAQIATEEGADYIGFGSVFKTLTKPSRSPMDLTLLSRIVHNSKIPVFAIGGIDLKNISQLNEIGIQRVVVCRAICQSRNCERTVENFKHALEN